ncbi:MAG: DUF7504 family protein [Candidatus Micrarchaeota archaeon]
MAGKRASSRKARGGKMRGKRASPKKEGRSKGPATPEPDAIVLLEADPEDAGKRGMAAIKTGISKGGKAVIISANRPYKTLMAAYRKNGIDSQRVMVIDCVSKPNNAEIEEADNVLYLESLTDLTDILLSVRDAIGAKAGRQFIFLDSITTMLIYNKPDTYARFIHNLLTMMRVKRVGGILLYVAGGAGQEVRAEIVQLCDKVIKA